MFAMRQHFDCSVLKRSKNINKSSKQISWAHFFNVLYAYASFQFIKYVYTIFTHCFVLSLPVRCYLGFAMQKVGIMCTQWIKKETTIHLRHSKYQRQLKEQDISPWSKWFEILFLRIHVDLLVFFAGATVQKIISGSGWMCIPQMQSEFLFDKLAGGTLFALCTQQ